MLTFISHLISKMSSPYIIQYNLTLVLWLCCKYIFHVNWVKLYQISRILYREIKFPTYYFTLKPKQLLNKYLWILCVIKNYEDLNIFQPPQWTYQTATVNVLFFCQTKKHIFLLSSSQNVKNFSKFAVCTDEKKFPTRSNAWEPINCLTRGGRPTHHHSRSLAHNCAPRSLASAMR